MARDPSKTEQATPKRVRKARNKGNVAKSQEVSKTMSILAGLIAMMFWLQYISANLQRIFRYFMTNSASLEVNEANLRVMAIWLSAELAKMILPVLLIIGLFVFLIIRLQVGKLWTTQVFKPKLSKFNPINGLKRMFVSMQTLIRLGKSVLQALCIGIAPLMVMKEELPHIMALYHMDTVGVSIYILTVASKMVMYALVPMVIIAAADFWYTKWDYKENLKMTKSEVKDERKQAEGDPLVRNKMRQKMMQAMARRMMQAVPKADVVITNPTHIAVALSYNPEEAPAPVVVAMGADKLAEKIKDVAREHGVPIRENKPLARALYKQTEVGDTIPAELFQAVAVILAQIWKTKPPKHVKRK